MLVLKLEVADDSTFFIDIHQKCPVIGGIMDTANQKTVFNFSGG